MIIKLTKNSITNICPGALPDDSYCYNIVEIPISNLKLGISSGSIILKDNIVLPTCLKCKGQETLFRYWHNVDPANPGFKNKQVNNFLSKLLKEAGQIDEGCKTEIMTETSNPPVILADYPSGDGFI